MVWESRLLSLSNSLFVNLVRGESAAHVHTNSGHVEDCEGWWLLSDCSSVFIALSRNEGPWVQLPVTSAFFLFSCFPHAIKHVYKLFCLLFVCLFWSHF